MNEQDRLIALCLEHELGTLADAEKSELEHLLHQADPAATAALAEARETLGVIGLSAPYAEPPARVKHALMEQVQAENPVHAVAPVIESDPFSRRAALAWAIAAGIMLFAFLQFRQIQELRNMVGELKTQTTTLAEERNQLAENSERFERILAIISGPETRTVSLSAPESPAMHAYWNEQHGLMLTGDNLPVSAPGRTLQLWVIPKQGNPISVDVFQPTQAGRALLLSRPGIALADANLLAITDEPAGGSPQPTTTPIWVGPIS